MHPERINQIYEVVVSAVYNVTGYGAATLSSRSAAVAVYTARHIAIYQLRLHGIPLMEIGKLLDRRHATVIYSLSKYGDYYQYDSDFRIKADKVAKYIDEHLNPE